MAADDDRTGEVLPPPQERLLELLALLAADAVASRADFTHAVVRRARRQQDARAALVVGSGVLAAAATGLVALFPAAGRATTEDG